MEQSRVWKNICGNIVKLLRGGSVLLYGSECWALKKTDEKRLHVAEMRMLRWMCGVTRMDKVRNEYIRGSLKVAPVTEKLQGNRWSWWPCEKEG
ncbi:unnamed protein product [Spodoptera exigua]|nr:unnamed protein product [Spodoptera exigua]